MKTSPLKICWFCINVDLLCTRDECAVVNMWVVFLFAKMSPRQKEREEKKVVTAFIFALFPFDRLTDRWSNWSPATTPTRRIFRAQCFRVTCFTSERLLDKKNPKRMKNSDAIKNKKKIIKSLSHTTYSHTPALHTYVHTYTRKNFILNYHQCHQSINQHNPQTLEFLLSSSPF